MGSIPLSKESTLQECWAWFMAHYTPETHKALYALAYRITGNPDDAAEVMQEALVQGALHCYQLKNEERFGQWMYSIVKRLAYRHKNKSTRNLLKRLRETCMEGCTRDTLDDYILRADERARLFTAIERLKSPAKEIMKLKYSGEWNLRIIAERLGINYHTTRSIYQRARHELMNELEEYYHEKR